MLNDEPDTAKIQYRGRSDRSGSSSALSTSLSLFLLQLDELELEERELDELELELEELDELEGHY